MACRSLQRSAILALVCFLSFKPNLLAQQTAESAPPPVSIAAAVPRLINLNGTLRDGIGRPLTGILGVTFSLYKDQQGGTPVWTENQNVQLDAQGTYSALLGVTRPTGLPAEVFAAGEPRWLGVQAQLPGEAEQPRVLLVSVPYALKAADADTLGGKPASAFVLADSSSAEQPLDKLSVSGAPLLHPRTSGTGSVNYLAKWADTSGTLANSAIIEVGGNVGIGTATPSQALTVNGAVRVANNQVFGFESTTPGTNAGRFYANTNNDMVFETNSGTNSMLFQTTGGKVGIGTSTAETALDVNITDTTTYTSLLSGSAPVSAQTYDGLAIRNPNDNANFSSLFFQSRTNGMGTGRIALVQDGARGGAFSFLTRSTSDNNMHEWMRITNVGNVGIGTSTPAATLDVAGDLHVSGNISGMVNLPAGGALEVNGTPFLHNYGTDNTFVGASAGNMTMTGSNNTADGTNALLNNTSGSYNTAIGNGALQSNTTGNNDTATGFNALSINTTGSNNTALGINALQINTTGNYNTATGAGALAHNTTGGGNTGAGYAALVSNTTGNDNTATGDNALANNTTGTRNTASGFFALLSNTTGTDNTATGNGALQINTTGGSNTAAGSGALYHNTTGNSNTAAGYEALYSNTTGNSNTALGDLAGQTANGANTTGSSNTFVGFKSGPGTQTEVDNATAIGANATVSQSNSMVLGDGTISVGIGTSTPGYRLDVQGGQINASGGLCISGTCQTSWPSIIGTNGNTSLGVAFQNNMTGSNNTAAGASALQNNTAGNSNTASGVNALTSNTSGSYNTASGGGALQSNSTGSSDTAAGYEALANNTTGNSNLADGFQALKSNTTGNSNTALGDLAGQTGNPTFANTTGSNNTFVGFQSGPGTSNEVDNATAIGANASVSQSNSMVLGDGTISVGIGTSTPGYRLDVQGGQINASGGLCINGVCQTSWPTIIGGGGINTATGSSALAANTTGSYNTAAGYSALSNNTTGGGNTATGYAALSSNTTGGNNTASGAGTLLFNTTGSSNTATGWGALGNNTTGASNTATGANALISNVSGLGNTATGANALQNTTAGGNTAVGNSALITNTTGNYNTAIGFGADVSTTGFTNATAIGNAAIVNASNKIRLGNSSVTVIEGQVAYTFTSDQTKKENFRPVNAEDVLKKLANIAVPSWNYIGQDATEFRHYGPMAQDFFAAFGNDGAGTIGTPTTINSGDQAGILMLAVKALEQRTSDAQKENQSLKAENARMRQDIQDLQNMVNALKSAIQLQRLHDRD